MTVVGPVKVSLVEMSCRSESIPSGSSRIPPVVKVKTCVVIGASWEEDGVALGGDVPFEILVPLEFRVKALLNDGRVELANASTAKDLLGT